MSKASGSTDPVGKEAKKTPTNMAKVTVETDVRGEDRLIMNQNYYVGWKYRQDDVDGVAEADDEGLISVPIPAGLSETELMLGGLLSTTRVPLSTGLPLLVASTGVAVQARTSALSKLAPSMVWVLTEEPPLTVHSKR